MLRLFLTRILPSYVLTVSLGVVLMLMARPDWAYALEQLPFVDVVGTRPEFPRWETHRLSAIALLAGTAVVMVTRNRWVALAVLAGVLPNVMFTLEDLWEIHRGLSHWGYSAFEPFPSWPVLLTLHRNVIGLFVCVVIAVFAARPHAMTRRVAVPLVAAGMAVLFPLTFLPSWLIYAGAVVPLRIVYWLAVDAVQAPWMALAMISVGVMGIPSTHRADSPVDRRAIMPAGSRVSIATYGERYQQAVEPG